MERLKVLLSAFACAPGEGSELGVGWNMARELAEHHDVWVLTQGKHRPFIEAELARTPSPHLHFEYYDLPRWAGWWRRGKRGVQPYYYLWQLTVYRSARRLHSKIDFDSAQHVTFAAYWKPSSVSFLPIPFVWGPVGGGDSTPEAFRSDFGLRGRAYEIARDLACRIGEHDPFVRLTARRSAMALASTENTADRLRAMGASNVRLLSQVGLSEEEVSRLRRPDARRRAHPARFVSVGRILHWKGFHLGLCAFARARLPGSEYWVVGDGPERKRLQALARRLGIAPQVKFLGRLPRDETLRKVGDCDVLVHPSLHESGGLVCLEAMASGIPVVCLDLGGPAVQVTDDTGFRVVANKPEKAVADLAAAMRTLSDDTDLRIRMGEAARRRAAESFSWREKGAYVAELHREVRYR